MTGIRRDPLISIDRDRQPIPGATPATPRFTSNWAGSILLGLVIGAAMIAAAFILAGAVHIIWEAIMLGWRITNA